MASGYSHRNGGEGKSRRIRGGDEGWIMQMLIALGDLERVSWLHWKWYLLTNLLRLSLKAPELETKRSRTCTLLLFWRVIECHFPITLHLHTSSCFSLSQTILLCIHNAISEGNLWSICQRQVIHTVYCYSNSIFLNIAHSLLTNLKKHKKNNQRRQLQLKWTLDLTQQRH